MENRITVSYKNVNLKKNKYNHQSIHPKNIVYYEYFKKLKRRAAVQGNTNLVISFKKIINSIFKYPLPIQSCLEANKLIGVGKGFSYHFDRAVTQLKKNQSLQNEIIDAGTSSDPPLNDHINKVIRGVDLLLKDLNDSGNIPIKNEELNDEETIIRNLNILDKEMPGNDKKKKKQSVQKSSLGNNTSGSLPNSAEDGNLLVDEPEKCFVFRKKEYGRLMESLDISLHRKRKEVELNETEIHILLVLYEGQDSSEENAMSKEEIQEELIKQDKGDLCVNYKSLHRLINMELVNKVEVVQSSILGISREVAKKEKKLKMVTKLQLSKIGKEFVSKEKKKMAYMNSISNDGVQEDYIKEVQTNDMKEETAEENENSHNSKDKNKHFHICIYDYESKFMRDNKHTTCKELQTNAKTYVINENTEYSMPLNEKVESEYEVFVSSKDSKESHDSGDKITQRENEEVIEDPICYNYSKQISNEEIENETKDLYTDREESSPKKLNHNHFSLDISIPPNVSKFLKNMNSPRSIEHNFKNSSNKKQCKEIKTKVDTQGIEDIIVLSELSDNDNKYRKMIQPTQRKEKRKRMSEEKSNVSKKKKKTSEKEKRKYNVSYGPYEIVMVIDNRDISGVHVEYFEKMKKIFDERGIKYVTRNLPLGDVIWLCRRRIYEEPIDVEKTNDENPKHIFNDFYNNAKERPRDNSNDKSAKYEEYVLKWIIERKTLNDLSSSIMDGRYDEQKYRLMRMKPTSHIIYLIENSNNSFKNYTSSSKIPYESLVNAMSSIQFMTGFSILHSQSMKHTIFLLSDMHSRIVRTVRECCGIENSGFDDIFPHDIRLEEYLLTEAFVWDVWFNDSKKSKNDLVKEVFGKQLRMLTNCGPDATELILSLWPTPFKLNQALNEYTHDGILANRMKKIYLRDKELEGKKVKSPVNMQLIGQLRRMFAPNTLNYNN